MNFKLFLIIFLYILLYDVLCDEENQENNNDNENNENNNIFEATTDWQVVKKGKMCIAWIVQLFLLCVLCCKGQRIPKGLHVRVNFETGVTEAKLLDENSDTDEEIHKTSRALSQRPAEEYDEIDKLLLEKPAIKEALKNIKNDEILKADDIKRIKDKFRTYDELKNELNDINLTPQIDAEVLTVLFERYKHEMEKESFNVYEILRIIEDFDFLAHQFDNGIEFVRQNGFNDVIYKNLNLSNTELRQATLKLFGSLTQNNAKVQIHALETGGISVLLRILSSETEVAIKSNAVSALSSLLRRFPLAQLKFVDNGGLSIMTKLFQSDSIKIQVKFATLISDLLVETQHAHEESLSTGREELVRQYNLVNLENLLLEHKWCESLNKLLLNLLATDPDDHDSVEKCLLSMHSISKKCGLFYQKSVLSGLELKYKQLAEDDSDKEPDYDNSDYFTNLNELCVQILQFTTNRLTSKNELWISC